MLNNEFRLIGTVVSEFEKAGSENFPIYFLTIEVERKRKGMTSHFTMKVYEKNYTVDVTKSMLGKRIIANGYLDEYKGHLDLVLQDMIVIGEIVAEKVNKTAEAVAAAPVAPTLDTDEIELPSDDDLPF